MRKGISLIVLMITIVLMLLIISTVTISARASFSNDQKLTFATEIASIQENVDEYYLKNHTLPILQDVILNLENIAEQEKIQFLDEKMDSNQIVLKQIDLSKFPQMEVIFGKGENETDIYAVSENTNRVYFLRGLHTDEMTYYTLTEDLRQMIGYQDETRSSRRILFESSPNKWTNQCVTTFVKVPKDYQNVRIWVIQNGKKIPYTIDPMIENTYYKYKIERINGIYRVEVDYQDRGVDKSENYEIRLFDDVKPEFSLSDPFMLEKEGKKYQYLKLLSYGDNLSGIKIMKYATSKIDDSQIFSYFSNNGITIENDMIIYEQDTKYITVYIEDMAGNYDYRVVTIE